MSVSDEKLMAYADGELSEAERAEVEAALAADAGLREKLEAHKRMQARFASSFDPILEEPVPDRLLAAARGETRSAGVVDLSARRAQRAERPRWSVREWGAMAASLLLGVFVSVALLRGEGPIAATSEGLVARGELARALDMQLAADEGGTVRIGLSFENRDGAYCRTFALQENEVAGLACRADAGWDIAMTAQGARGGEVRTAGSDTPAEIIAAVEAMIAGETLDAEAEAAARDAGWRASAD